MQYAGFSGTREIQAFRAINRAANLNQFTRAIQNFDVGSQNFLYADTAGNIAHYTSGEAPLREDLQAGAVDGLPPFLVRNGEGGNEWLPGTRRRSNSRPALRHPALQRDAAGGQSAARADRQFQ